MKIPNRVLWSFVERVVPGLVLLTLLVYTYAKFFGHPFGFRWNATGTISYVFASQPEPTLKVGDQIVQIGDLTWKEFSTDLNKVFFIGVKPGDSVPVVVDRNGQTLNIDWTYPSGPSREEFLDQFISEWFIAYGFWIAGLVTILLVRPKDARWLLMALFNFLTAIWLIAGSGSSAFHTLGSALILRMAVLLCIPVYLHLHWLFPQPLGKLPPIFVWSVYVVVLLLVVAQGLQLLPANFSFLAFFVALGGSLLLLIVHIFIQPLARRDLRLAFLAVLLVLTLTVTWGVAYSLNRIPAWLGSAGLLGLPLLPLAYLYSAFRRHLGGLETRINHFFSVYLFVVLLGIIELPLILVVDQFFQITGEAAITSLVSAGITAAAFIWGYPVFESFMERRILGIPLPSRRLLESYSIHITTSISLPALIRVLQEEVFPSLLIRQFAFLHYDQRALTVLSRMGLDTEPLPEEKDVPELLARSNVYRSPDLLNVDQTHGWLRLALPLRLGDRLIGFWLFGRRDPDDFYSQPDIQTLSSLANLTAIALSNILQTERLRSMYQANINRYEEERVRLARDLHDIILNELAALPIRSDAPSFSPSFQQEYDAISDHLRYIIHDVRPAMLKFGLKLALESHIDQLRERNSESVEILTDIQAEGECHYPLLVENNLYRIVQEACENSLRYSEAKKLSIVGRLTETQIQLGVEDGGKGIDPQISLKLDDLAIQKHYGLTGMHERASVIGADLQIVSKPNEGTQIHITWKSKDLS